MYLGSYSLSVASLRKRSANVTESYYTAPSLTLSESSDWLEPVDKIKIRRRGYDLEE